MLKASRSFFFGSFVHKLLDLLSSWAAVSNASVHLFSSASFPCRVYYLAKFICSITCKRIYLIKVLFFVEVDNAASLF